jgi:putative endonuclease
VSEGVRKRWRVYLVQCRGGSYYCGATVDVERRVATHNKGKGAKYTRSRLPVVLVACSKFMTKSDALKLEHRVKKAKRKDKLKLVVPGFF